MHESKDLAIKLFGKNIPLPSDDDTPAIVVVLVDQDETETENKDYKEEEEKESSEGNNPPKTPSIDEEKPAMMKKPEKILRCPRCNSMDTKFCYFNNYNVNQPRHFCKSCHRYWTSGGSIRNVPVGAGRRKSKPFSAAAPPPPEFSPAVPTPPPCLGPPWVPWPPAVPFYPCWWVPSPPPPPPAKRPRDQEGGRVLVPKTLRIDDPAEAAKSSIWAALGIGGNDGVGMFGGFRKKSKECVVDDNKKKKNNNENNPVLAANPAALSRSINFHETS